jgi:hypothetical protein
MKSGVQKRRSTIRAGMDNGSKEKKFAIASYIDHVDAKK